MRLNDENVFGLLIFVAFGAGFAIASALIGKCA